jgi:hypothetical protein
MKCPRCKKETDKLTGGADGYYDKITKRKWASSSTITGRNDTVCENCYHEIRLQDKEYAAKHQEYLERQRDSIIFNAIHDAIK